MAVILAQTTIRAASNVPADNIMTTFHYEDTRGAGPGDTSLIRAAMSAFWTEIDGYISTLVSSATGNVEYAFYNLDDPQPRQPFGEGAYTVLRTGTPLPPEVACCLSYRGDYVSGQPNARRRGRFYVGPLNTGALAADRFDPTFIEELADAGKTMVDAINAITDIEFGVWSPTGSVFTPASRLWVDNEVDIQRRRGRIATTREERNV